MQEEKAKTLNARGEKALEDYKNVLQSLKVWKRLLIWICRLAWSSLMATFCSLAIVPTPTAHPSVYKPPILFQEAIIIIHTQIWKVVDWTFLGWQWSGVAGDVLVSHNDQPILGVIFHTDLANVLKM